METLAKLFFVVILFLVPAIIHAHDDGLSLEKNISDMIIDIGYSAPFISGEQIRIDLSIKSEDTKETIPFDSAWIRLEKEGKMLFAAPISYGEFGKPGFSYVFPQGGEYTLFARFERSGETLVQGQFDINVERGEEDGSGIPLYMSVAALIGMIAGFFISRAFKRNA